MSACTWKGMKQQHLGPLWIFAFLPFRTDNFGRQASLVTEFIFIEMKYLMNWKRGNGLNIQTEFNLAGKPDVHSKLIVHDRCIYQVPGYLVRQLGTRYNQPASRTKVCLVSVSDTWYLLMHYRNEEILFSLNTVTQECPVNTVCTREKVWLIISITGPSSQPGTWSW